MLNSLLRFIDSSSSSSSSANPLPREPVGQKIPLLIPICNPLLNTAKSPEEQKAASATIENSLMQCARQAPDWLPDSVKHLLLDTAFVYSAADMHAALRGDKNHIVWPVGPQTLMAWEKQENGKWTLKIFCSTNNLTDLPPMQGSFLETLFSAAISFMIPLSLAQWTANLKTRVAPLILAYENLSDQNVTEAWLVAVEQMAQDGTGPSVEQLGAIQNGANKPGWTLFSPLEELDSTHEDAPRRKSVDLMAKRADEGGYMHRFMAKPQGPDHAWWLHKAWLRDLIEPNDYKRFTFLCRFHLLKEASQKRHPDRSSEKEIASKLIRSLYKNRAIREEEKGPLLERLGSIHKEAGEASNPLSALGSGLQADHSPPTEELNRKHPSRRPAPVEPEKKEAVEQKIDPELAYITPHEWKSEKNSFFENEWTSPSLDGLLVESRWQLEGFTIEEKLSSLIHITDRYSLLSPFSISYVRKSAEETLSILRKRLVFKHLLCQIGNELAESIYLIPHEQIDEAQSFSDADFYTAWKQHIERLRPKKDLFFRSSSKNFFENQVAKKAQDYAPLANIFSEAFDSKPATRPFQEYFVDFLSRRGIIYQTETEEKRKEREARNGELKHTYPQTLKFLTFLRDSLEDYFFNNRPNEFNPGLYEKESNLTRSEAFDPFSTPAIVAGNALPEIAPQLALINYMQVPDALKYSENANLLIDDLFFNFFQDTFDHTNLMSQGDGGVLGMVQKLYQNDEDQLAETALRNLTIARASGTLPWTGALENPAFRLFFEQFLEVEYKKLENVRKLTNPVNKDAYFSALLGLLRLSALCLRQKRDIQIPRFEKLVYEAQGRDNHQITLDRYQVDKCKAYLFWIYAEKEELNKAQQFRPLSKSSLRRANPNEQSDYRMILAHLKRLDDFPKEHSLLLGIDGGQILSAHASRSSSSAEVPDLIGRYFTEYNYQPKWWDTKKTLYVTSPSVEKARDGYWRLPNRSGLVWKDSPAKENHKAELINPSTNQVVSRIFIYKSSYSYPHYSHNPQVIEIPFNRETGSYAPRNLEEALFVLWKACERRDLKQKIECFENCLQKAPIDSISYVATYFIYEIEEKIQRNSSDHAEINVKIKKQILPWRLMSIVSVNSSYSSAESSSSSASSSSSSGSSWPSSLAGPSNASSSFPSSSAPEIISHELDIHWGTDEKAKPIVLNYAGRPDDSDRYDPDEWTLEDRPHLFWRKSEPGELHKNELIERNDDGTERTVSHIFYLGSTAFEIPIDPRTGEYAPRNLEERLCLLGVSCSIGDEKGWWEMLQQCPTVTHRLSPSSLLIMQSILASLQPTNVSFEKLGLYMQTLDRFCSWLSHPSLSLDEGAKVQFQTISAYVFHLYQDLAQNVRQEHLLSPTQIKRQFGVNIAFVKRITAPIISRVKELLPFWIRNLLDQLPSSPMTLQNLIANRSIQFLSHEMKSLRSYEAFLREEAKEINKTAKYYQKKVEDSAILQWRHLDWHSYRRPVTQILNVISSMIVYASCLVGLVALRLLGSRHIFAHRLEVLEATASLERDFFPVEDDFSSPDRISRRRLELATRRHTVEGNHPYELAISDWAWANRIPIKPGESIGAFIARAEVLKHVQSVWSRAFQIGTFLFSYYLLGYAKAAMAITMGATMFTSGASYYLQALGSLLYTQWPKAAAQNLSIHTDRKPFAPHRTRPPAPVSQLHHWEEISHSKEAILRAANPVDRTRALHLSARLAEPITWTHIEKLFLRREMHGLREINPVLTLQECELIDKAFHAHLVEHADELTASLGQNPAYDPNDRSNTLTRVLLLFEYNTKMRVRVDQYRVITDLLKMTDTEQKRYINRAIQMPMGGGKTDIIASIILIMASLAKPRERISAFVPPAAQFDSLANMLTNKQKRRFGQEVIPIDIPFTALQNFDSLQWLQDKILEAKEEGHVLLFHPHTLHSLKLLYIVENDPERLEALFRIKLELEQNTDVLIDELDQNLEPLKDTSLSHGSPLRPTKIYLDDYKELILLHEEVDKKLWGILCRNAPDEIDEEAYKSLQRNQIAPRLIQKFFSAVPEHLKESCKRYLVGEATREQDGAFAGWLSTSALRDRITLHRHWLEDILRFTIFRERDRHYGRKGTAAEPGKGAEVGPYLGVQTPGTDKFVFLGEILSYHWLTALSSPLDPEYFGKIIEEFNRRKTLYQSNPSLQRQVLAECQELTGYSIEQLTGNSDLRRFVLAEINESPKKKLACEHYLAQLYVTYYESQFTSTSQHLMTMFNTTRGFSGTFPGFIYAFDHIVDYDPESDASVIRAVEEHNERVITIASAKQLLELYRNNSKMGALMDAGGIFRDMKNEEVAKSVLEHLPHIQKVLFFGKKSPKDSSPDTPTILARGQNGEFLTQIVGSTEKHILDSWGVKQESLFVYYDERHCEGTDVKQLENRHSATTFGPSSTLRDQLQSIMRMRRYKDRPVHQTVDFVMTEATKEKLFPGDFPSAPLLLQKAREIEEEATQRKTLKTLQHAVDAAFALAVENYRARRFKTQPANCEKLSKFLLHFLNHPSAYEQFGGFSVEKVSKEKLLKYLSDRKEAFRKIYPEPLPQSLDDHLQEIAERIRASRHLAERVIEREAAELGQQQRVQQAVQQQVEQAQETATILPKPGAGTPWKEQFEFIPVELSQHYGSITSGRALVSRAFDKELFQGLKASPNLLHTYQAAYALNHPDQKQAHYILLERSFGGELTGTLLASYDYQQYVKGEKTLSSDACICYWKPTANGEPMYLKGDLRILSDKDKQTLRKIRLQTAFFNGDVLYIFDHKDDLANFMGSFTKDHARFLRKRTEYWAMVRKEAQFLGFGSTAQSLFKSIGGFDRVFEGETQFEDARGRRFKVTKDEQIVKRTEALALIAALEDHFSNQYH